MMEIKIDEKRRARNLIWNAAGDYSFEPDFKAYDQDGRADLYWNSIIGAVRKNFGEALVSSLMESFSGCVEQALYEELAWIALESAAYRREASSRPALPSLRRSYARRVLELSAGAPSDRLLDVLETAHFRRALGEDPVLRPRDREYPGCAGGLRRNGGRCSDGPYLRRFGYLLPLRSRQDPAGRGPGRAEKALLFRLPPQDPGRSPAVRGFGYGFGEHTSSDGGKDASAPPQRRITDLTVAQSEAALATYIRDFFGPPLYGPQQMKELEGILCTGDHTGCHLYYARGDGELDRNVRGYAGAQRRAALKQMEKNKAAYEADAVRHRTSIARLTARIRNAMLAYLQPTVVQSSSGALEAGRVWRGLCLGDDKVFTKVLRTDPGDISVDLLLDGSTSQLDRQETVSAQGYIDRREPQPLRHPCAGHLLLFPQRLHHPHPLPGLPGDERQRAHLPLLHHRLQPGRAGPPGAGQGAGAVPL